MNYTTGWYVDFTATTPRHVRFWCGSMASNLEDTNLRLIDTTANISALSFRLGYNDYMRINS